MRMLSPSQNQSSKSQFSAQSRKSSMNQRLEPHFRLSSLSVRRLVLSLDRAGPHSFAKLNFSLSLSNQITIPK